MDQLRSKKMANRWGAIWEDTERKNEAWDGVKRGLFDISSHAERCV